MFDCERIAVDVRRRLPAMGGAALTLINDWDGRASSWLYLRNRGVIGKVARVLSALGSERLLIPGAALVTVAAVLDRQVAGALVLAAATMMTRLCFTLLKGIVPRSRPPVSGLSSNSFPSGHVMASIVVYGTVAFVLTHSNSKWILTVTITSTLLAAAVGIARVIRGFHWLTDVAAGIMSGLVLLSFAYIGLRWL